MLSCIISFVVVALFAYSRTEQMCLPDKVHYTLLLTAQMAIKNETIYVEQFVDFENRKVLNIDREYSYLFLFNQSVGYRFNNNSCSKGTVGPWVDFKCIPSTAMPSQPYRLGWKPSLNVVDYYWQFGSSYVKTSVADNFTPIQLVYSTNGTLQDAYIMLFEDYVPFINDTHTFDVPEICKRASMMSVYQQGERNKFVPKDEMLFKKFIKEEN